MSDYYMNRIAVTVADFDAVATRHRGKVMSTIGWDSSYLDAVRSTLAGYWKNPTKTTHHDLQQAVLRWRAQKPSEFTNRDQISGGVCTRLLNDVNTPDRGRGMRSVILFGTD